MVLAHFRRRTITPKPPEASGLGGGAPFSNRILTFLRFSGHWIKRLGALPVPGDISEGGIEPLTIVVSFDIGEQLSFRYFPRGKTGLVHEFGFQSAEAAFHRCVVPAISLPAHGLDHPD